MSNLVASTEYARFSQNQTLRLLGMCQTLARFKERIVITMLEAQRGVADTFGYTWEVYERFGETCFLSHLFQSRRRFYQEICEPPAGPPSFALYGAVTALYVQGKCARREAVHSDEREHSHLIHVLARLRRAIGKAD